MADTIIASHRGRYTRRRPSPILTPQYGCCFPSPLAEQQEMQSHPGNGNSASPLALAPGHEDVFRHLPCRKAYVTTAILPSNNASHRHSNKNETNVQQKSISCPFGPIQKALLSLKICATLLQLPLFAAFDVCHAVSKFYGQGCDEIAANVADPSSIVRSPSTGPDLVKTNGKFMKFSPSQYGLLVDFVQGFIQSAELSR